MSSGSPPICRKEVQPGTTFVPGGPRVLFSIQGFLSTSRHQWYDVNADGQRFVMIRNRVSEEVEAASEFIVVENFFEELRGKVGNQTPLCPNCARTIRNQT